MASDTDFRRAVDDLLDQTPLRGDLVRAQRRGSVLRRRRLAMRATGVLTAVLALTAAVVVVGRDGASESTRIDVVDQPSSTIAQSSTTVDRSADVLTALPPGSITSVAAIGHDVWVVRSDIGAVQHWRVSADATFVIVASLDLQGLERVAIGAEHVWAYGDTEICVIDPSSDRAVTGHGGDGSVTPGGFAFTTDAAWVTDSANDRVLRLALVAGQLAIATVATGDQPTDIVATRSGDVWVRESGAGTIARIETATLQIAERHQWSGALLAPANDTSLWASSGLQLVELDPRALAVGQSVAQGERIVVDAVRVVDDGESLWIATRDGHLRRYGRGSAGAFESITFEGTLLDLTVVDGTAVYTTTRTPGLARWAP
jgi:hypothetical protein